MNQMKARVRTSVVVVHNDKLLTFFAIDPTSGAEYYFLPGGAVEPHETAPEAAERECLEETGFAIEVSTENVLDIEYFFNWDGQDYDCLTFFYNGYLKSPMAKPKTVNDRDYNKGVVWVPLSEVEKTFAYSEPIRKAVTELIEKR